MIGQEHAMIGQLVGIGPCGGGFATVKFGAVPKTFFLNEATFLPVSLHAHVARGARGKRGQWQERAAEHRSLAK